MKYHELLQAKHEAVRAYREAADEEARAIAWAGVDAASSALDAALVEAEEAREDAARIEAVEARERAASIVGSTAPVSAPNKLADEARDFMTGKTNHLVVPLGYDPPDSTVIVGAPRTTTGRLCSPPVGPPPPA